MLPYFPVHRQYVLALLSFACCSELENLLGCDIPTPYSTYNGVFKVLGAERPDEAINAVIYSSDGVIIMVQLNELSSLSIAEVMERKAGGLCKGTSKILVLFPHCIFFLLSRHIQI